MAIFPRFRSFLGGQMDSGYFLVGIFYEYIYSSALRLVYRNILVKKVYIKFLITYCNVISSKLIELKERNSLKQKFKIYDVYCKNLCVITKQYLVLVINVTYYYLKGIEYQ